MDRERERGRRREGLSASWGSPGSLSLWQHRLRALRALTISFIKKESFKPTLKCREGVSAPRTKSGRWFQERSLIAEGSASCSTFRDIRNHKYTCMLGAQCSSRYIRYYQFFKIWWSLTIKSFKGEEEDFEFYSELYGKPMQWSQDGSNMISLSSFCQNTGSCILDQLESL